MRTWSDLCLVCEGQQDFVVNVHEAGPYERSHDYTRVLFCRACGIGELRSFSYDGFVVFGEEDEVMVWSSILSASDVDLLRTGFACALRLAGGCECPQAGARARPARSGRAHHRHRRGGGGAGGVRSAD